MKIIKLTLAITMLPALGMPVFAEHPDSLPPVRQKIAECGLVTVVAPEALDQRLQPSKSAEDDTTQPDAQAASTHQTHGRQGYRVEVYADNNVRSAKINAASKKRAMQSRFPQYNIYLVFEAPFWRVRMGDFTSKSAAENAMAEVKRAFPAISSGLRVVRCNINPSDNKQ